MNHSTGASRTPAAVIVAVVAALLAAACSGSPSSTGSGGSPSARGSVNSSSLVGYSHCMRSHGVANWPDPTVDSEGRPDFNLLHVRGFDPNAPQINNKMRECGHVMPAGGGIPVIAPGGPG